MGSPIALHVGTDKYVVVQLRTPQDDTVAYFTADDAPYAEVSSGGNLPVLWSPPAVWSDPTLGKFVIQFLAADTGARDAGKYVVRTGVLTQDGRKVAAGELDLTLLPSPTTVALEPVCDVTYQRLLADAPWLADSKTAPQNYAGFLGERGQARQWFIENVLLWYDNWRLRFRLSEGWYYSSPSPDRMRQYLNDGDYILTDRILRLQAAKAISIICSNALTPGGKPEENQYQDVAAQMTNRANSLFAGLQIQVVNADDGVDVTFDDNSLTNNITRWY